MQKLEELLELGGTRKNIILLAIGGISLILSLALPFDLPVDPAWIAIILCGIPIILETVIGLVTAFDIKADVLVSLALIASVLIGEYFAAGEVAFIMQLGALLEDLTVARARAGIEKLVQLTPATARVVRNGVESIVAAEQVLVGDLLRVLPGETVPVDGVITAGQTSINQAVMTGESLPVDKAVGDEVSSGTVNQFGAFEMQATRVGEDSSIQRMIRLVQSADAGKAKIVGLADRWATWVVVIALTAAVLTFLFTHEMIRSVTILVVFCPCALVLATPTAIMAAIGNATRHSCLVREGDALERLAKVERITFDKTGTLTVGEPSVVEVVPADPDTDRKQLYCMTASAEQNSEHPLGKSIVSSFTADGSKLKPASDFRMIPGKGVMAHVEHADILAGNMSLLQDQGICMEEAALSAARRYQQQGCTVIYVGIDGRYAGFLALADTIRPAAARMISEVRQVGVTPVLLTGDHHNAAASIASQLGIDEYQADCLPEDKMRYIENAKQPVCMIGDGVNDAPALKRAYVGIAMGGIGSDIAVDAADIALVNDDIKELPHLFALAKHMMIVIRCNLTFSMTLNFVAIVLAITGILNPVIGALVHNCGSVFVIINSSLLLHWKKKSE